MGASYKTSMRVAESARCASAVLTLTSSPVTAHRATIDDRSISFRRSMSLPLLMNAMRLADRGEILDRQPADRINLCQLQTSGALGPDVRPCGRHRDSLLTQKDHAATIGRGAPPRPQAAGGGAAFGRRTRGG